ncbi:F plasmid transfer operon family protein [Orientia tsutsugamushi str. TA716]|uniref:F plasmid transfer operon family protein n=1 Tax=Orientia tsutsugamushi str. TA716 TaxID=1359175 RepID=A0A0F3NZ35_ORITS|nr:F plasmid transfer operon family protein [Orientia tsutsugamushi str. TA716]
MQESKIKFIVCNKVSLNEQIINVYDIISHLSTVDASPTGFLWYNDKHGHELDESTSKLMRSAHDHRIEELKEQFNRAQRIALDNPTLENVITAQRLQNKSWRRRISLLLCGN